MSNYLNEVHNIDRFPSDDETEDDEEEPITAEALIRAMANGCPLDTAPDHIWRAYCEAMRELAQRVLREREQKGGTAG